MVAAGGVGNMIDRIMYGYVQDMFKVELFNFAIFNVADIFITVFAILFALAMIFEKPEEDITDELYEDDEDEDDEDYEDKPVRKPLLSKVKEKRQAARSASKRSRQEKYEREYEEYRAQQLEAMNMSSAPRKSSADAQNAQAIKKARQPQQAPARKVDTPAPAAPRKSRDEDPFAAWEKAAAKHDKQREANYAEKAMGTGVRPSQPQKPVQRQPVQQPAAEEAMERPAQKLSAEPVLSSPLLSPPQSLSRSLLSSLKRISIWTIFWLNSNNDG